MKGIFKQDEYPNYIGTMDKYLSLGQLISLSICLVLMLAPLASCDNQLPDATGPLVTIELTEIVDKSTQRPITENIITLRWETSDGEVLDTQEYKSQSSLSTTLPADGDTRLWIIVEAVGYKPWENVIRMKLNDNKPLYIDVEKERWDAFQG
jgi:hypothetical protein